MNGLGFLIWQVNKMPATDRLIGWLKLIDARWVSIKLADGVKKFNTQDNNDKAIKALIEALKAAGIEVGGWHYSYGEQPGLEGDVAMERIEKLKLSHWLIDVESEWSKPYGGPRSAKSYCSKLKVGGLTVGLCSFRYPDYWPDVPFSAFLLHEAVDVNAPQVYPIGAHNFAAQLDRSFAEYEELSYEKPFIPIGPTFGSILRDGSWWEPTAADLAEFVKWCKNNRAAKRVSAYGFYSLDWIFQHNRIDWLEAITGKDLSEPAPAPKPDPMPEPSGEFRLKVTASRGLNIRSGPGINYADIGDLPAGSIVTVKNIAGSSAWVEIEPGKFACVQLGKERYAEPV